MVHAARGRTGHRLRHHPGGGHLFKTPRPSHEPSMLQDIRAGKKTEIDALNGAVMQLGQKHNLPVPYNIAIYRIIKFMENQ